MGSESSAVITVSWRHRVFFTEGVFAETNPVLRNVILEQKDIERAAVFMDEGVARNAPAALPAVTGYLNAAGIDVSVGPVILPGGESLKQDQIRLMQLYAEILRSPLCRHSLVLAIGGGALLDLVGFAAATAHRGLRTVRLPTTTLSQADSGVGVKNGIDGFGQKNAIGTFAVPLAVINDFDFLFTQPASVRRSGFAESVKVALVRDAAFFRELEECAEDLVAFRRPAVQRVVQRTAELHFHHITTSGDPFESGNARPLDFGHWAAHKLEVATGYRLSHGDAVAIGIAVDSAYSMLAGVLAERSCERIFRLLDSLGFPLSDPVLLATGPDGSLQIISGLDDFQRHLGGAFNLTLIRRPGEVVEAGTVDRELMARAIRRVAAWSKNSAATGT